MSLHEKLIIVDGLVISNWGQEVFKALREGSITAINASCAVWEGPRRSLDNIAQWLQWFDCYATLIMPVHRTADILAAKEMGKTGVILGFQNTSPIGDRLGYLAVYKQLGVGIIQITYNTQNLIGSGCYESHDTGLSDFGREAIAEMNRLGLAVDLSHVGTKTTDDVIDISKDPVVFSHILPRELKNHPRNKETRQLRKVADKGGLIGVTMFPAFLPKDDASTVDDWAEIIEWMVDKCGEDHVAYGTDFSQGYGRAYSQWLCRDKGYARKLAEFGDFKYPKGIERIEHTPNLTAALERRKWNTSRIEKVMGLNWLAYLRIVWHE